MTEAFSVPADQGVPADQSLQVALETSVRAASVAIAAEGSIHTKSLEAGRAHASDLLPCLNELLADRPLSPEWIAVGLGPGSYTGLRVGIATALGLAEGSGAHLVGVPSVEALAWRLLAPGEIGAVVLDARGGEFYLACYERGGEVTNEVLAPTALRPEELSAHLPAAARVFTEPALVEHPALASVDADRILAGEIPDAASVLQLGALRYAAHGPQDPAQVRPLYLRPFGVKPRKR